MKLGRVRGKFIVGLLLSFAAIGICIYMLPPLYFRARSYYWHWKHHDLAQVGSYDVPVPSQWFVFSDNGNSLLLYDVESKRWASVMISMARRVDMAVWKNRDILSKPGDPLPIKNTVEFTIGNEQMACSEYLLLPKNAAFSVSSCRAPALEIIFSGNAELLPKFYEWARTIRPVSVSRVR